MGEATGTAIHDVAEQSSTNEAEVKQALRELAQRGEETLEGAREGVNSGLARP
jgi:hypothetical protein